MLSRLVTHSCRGFLSHTAKNVALFQQTVTHSCRGLSHSAKNVALFQQTVTHSCRGLSHSAKNVAQQKAFNPRRRREVYQLPPSVKNSIALAGVSAFGLAALAYYGKQMSKEGTNVILYSTTLPQYVRDRMTSANLFKLGGVPVVVLSTIAAYRSTAWMKFAASLSPGRLIAMGLGCIVAIHLVASFCDSKPVGWWFKHIALGAPMAAFCVGAGGLGYMGVQVGSAGFAVGLSIAAMTAPSEKFLITKSGPLAMGLGAVCAYSIGNCFLPLLSLSSAAIRLRVFIAVCLLLSGAGQVKEAQHVFKNASEIPRLFDPLDYGLV